MMTRLILYTCPPVFGYNRQRLPDLERVVAEARVGMTVPAAFER